MISVFAFNCDSALVRNLLSTKYIDEVKENVNERASMYIVRITRILLANNYILTRTTATLIHHI